MKKLKNIARWTIPALLASSLGCHHPGRGVQVDGPAPQPLGAAIDQMNMTQELNAEASKFVVYAHEFELNKGDMGGWKLNEFGEDHVQRIAANLNRGSTFMVVVERSRTGVREGTEYELPIHYNEELDAKRRKVIIAALTALGVADAESRVIIAPAFAEGLDAAEAAGANRRGGGAGGGGGGGGGFGGFGFGGGIF